MSWKNTLGQFIGIFIGVSLGATAVHMLMGKGRHPSSEQQPYVAQLQPQRPVSLFDQAVSNIQTKQTQ